MWNDLTMQQKSDLMQMTGIFDPQRLRQEYDSYLNVCQKGGGIKSSKKWKALDKIQYNVYPDTTFTRDRTGYGDIEVFDRNNGDTITYPNGYMITNPYPGQNTIIYNPKTNNEQDIRLDALHLMPQDVTYDVLNTKFRNAALNSDVYYNAKRRYEQDSALYGRDNIDDFGQYYKNEADGFLRNMFIEGTPEYIESKRYYPDKKQLIEWNMELKPYVDDIGKYLQTGERPVNILPEVTITPNEYSKGGSIHINPKNKGKFNATKKRTGKTTEELTHSKNPVTRKRAIFAQNARRWAKRHDDGGYIDDIIWDNNGQWAHPGQVTGIIGTKDGTDITMNGVGSWILGIDDLGNKKLMKPGRNYHFNGGKVVEYPLMYQYGGMIGKPISNVNKLVSNILVPSIQSLYSRNPQNAAYLPRFAKDYVGSIGNGNVRADNLNGQKRSKQDIVDFFWSMENKNNIGLNDDGTYSRYKDPNGKDWDVGPGLKIGSAIENKPYYTKDEIDEATYNYFVKSMNGTRPLYDDKYGVGSFDKLDDNAKMVISDVIYRVGQNGVNPTTWPKIFQAAHDNDTLNLLQQSRTTFKHNGATNYDNARVQRLGEYLYPDLFEYQYKNSLDPGLKVTRKQYGGLIKPFSYFNIPVVRFDEGGYAYI